VFAVAILALLPGLGDENVWSKDEARDGLVAREMIETGRWLIPHLGGRVYPYKPPLFHWMVASISLRGVTEWTLRLPSVLAAAATVALTYAIGARLGPPLTGLVAAAVLLSSTTFVEWARIGRLEMVLLACLTLAFWSGLAWLDEGRRRHAAVLGVALGLGCLTKGPVGLAPLGILVLALVLLRCRPRRALADLGLALALALALPAAWLGLAVAAKANVGPYLEAVVARFLVEVRVTREHYPLFAAEAIGIGFLPWTPALIAALVILARRWRASWRALVLPLLWAASVVVTFTLVISPRVVYFLPIFPPLALLVGWAWTACADQDRRWMLYALMASVAVFILAGVELALWPLTIDWKRHVTVLSRGFGSTLAVVAASAGIGLIVLWRRRRTDLAPLVVAVAALVVLMIIQIVVRAPRSNLAFPTREVAARFAAALPPEAEVAYMDLKLSTALMFYTPRPRVEWSATPPDLEMAEHPRRYALLPSEIVTSVWKEWGDCSLPPPLREATLFGSRYLLVKGSDARPTCFPL
jgi:4-amino-4-deoxy-L-arabinose transferase-like glycosyltransferase